MFGLRQQLASAQQAEAQLRKEVQQLRQQLGVAAAATSSRGEGSEDLSPRSSRSSGSAASPPCTAGRQGAAALQGRLDGLARELAAAKQEVGLRVARLGRACRGGTARTPVHSMPRRYPLRRAAHPPMPLVMPAGLPSCPPAAALPHPPPQIARLAGDRDRLRDELDARDTELMELQGQLVLLRAQAADDSDNWLSPLPDPV